VDSPRYHGNNRSQRQDLFSYSRVRYERGHPSTGSDTHGLARVGIVVSCRQLSLFVGLSSRTCRGQAAVGTRHSTGHRSATLISSLVVPIPTKNRPHAATTARWSTGVAGCCGPLRIVRSLAHCPIQRAPVKRVLTMCPRCRQGDVPGEPYPSLCVHQQSRLGRRGQPAFLCQPSSNLPPAIRFGTKSSIR